MSIYHLEPGDIVDALRKAGVDPLQVGMTPIFVEATRRCNSIEEIVAFCKKVFGSSKPDKIVECRMLENEK